MSVNTKWAFLNPSHIQFKQLKDLLDTRIEENNGETIFEIGVCEREESGLGRNEYAQSVCTIFEFHFMQYFLSSQFELS